MALLRTRGGGLLATGPDAVRANAMRQQQTLLQAARAPNVMRAPTTVIQEENPLNNLGAGLALFGKTLAAQKQKQIENQMARERAQREGALANSLIASRQAQADNAKLANEIRALNIRKDILINQFNQASISERQRKQIEAELNKVKLQIEGRIKAAAATAKANQVVTLSAADAERLGLNPDTDLVQRKPDGTLMVTKGVKPPTGDEPSLERIPIPPKAQSAASVSAGIGRLAELGRKGLQFFTGDTKDSEPTTELLKTIDNINNEVVNFASSVRTGGGSDRVTNFARLLTMETMPKQDLLSVPADYVTSVRTTAQNLRNLVRVLEAEKDGAAPTKAKIAARARLPKARQLADFYSRLEKQVVGELQSFNFSAADAIVGIGQ